MTERFERRQRFGIRLTAKDKRIIEAVYEARYLTNEMIGRLFFTPSTLSYCRQRMRYLFDRGFLGKRKVGVSDPDIYFLRGRGRHYIEQRFKVTREQVKETAGISGQKAAFPMLYMRHDLTLSRLYVEARLICERQGWGYAWDNTRVLERELAGIQPDARLTVEGSEDIRRYYIEFTDQIDHIQTIDRKIDAYEQLWQSRRQYVPVLWFVTSLARLKQVTARIRERLVEEYFLVALIEDKRDFLIRDIWWCATRTDKVQLLKPKEVVLYREKG